MGFGIVMWLDDRAVRDQVAADGPDAAGAAVAEALVRAVGVSDYPQGGLEPLSDGPWQRLGACYMSHLVGIEIDGSGGRLLGDGEEVDWAPPGIWQPQLTVGTMARATQDMMRHPSRLAVAMARHGGNMADAVYGPNVVAGRSVASLWCVYANAVGSLRPDPAIGAAVLAGLDTHMQTAVPAGSFANAVSKAGSLLADTAVGLVWSGGRICIVDELTDSGRPLLERRGRHSG